MSQQPATQRLRPFKPQRFGRYTLLMPLSTGGMGEIFLARLEGAHGFDKLCVIKKILNHLAEDPEFVERFVDEARILVKLSHGNIAQVLDMGVHERAPYIALEFIDGKDLRRVLGRMRDRQLPIPLSFVLYAMIRVLDALAYAHRKRGDDDQELNLVHRDVSPQNLLISYEGEVKVIDFGLAKSTLSSSRTNPSIIMGKFLYMSPEQARHQKVDRRSDLYAVGLCLYELVTGRNPFDDVPPGEVMVKVASPELKPLHEADPLCPLGLSEAVSRALAPDPAQRFQTAEEFRARLVSLLLEIDPTAGAETAARFMREAFAVEYHAERKMLAALREQARSMVADDAPEPQTEPETELRHETPLEQRAVTVEALPAQLPDALSFQPTRKGGLPPAPRSRDEMPTEAALPAVQVPSVVVDGLESTTSEPLPPEPKPRTPRASSKVNRTTRKRERSGEKPGHKRDQPKAPDLTPRPALPAVPKPPATVMLERPTPRVPGLLVWLVLPLLALAAVGGYIAWDVYSEQLKAAQLEDERHLDEQRDILPERRTREVKVDQRHEEDLSALPVPARDAGVAKLPVPVRRPTVTRSPTGDAALQALKADFGRLADEGVAKKFKLRVSKLEFEAGTRSNDPAWLEDVRRLHAEVKAELATQP